MEGWTAGDLRSPSGRRIIVALGFCQAMLLTNNAIIFSLNSIMGSLCASDKALATLPITAYVLGTAATTMPASFLMRRIGRSRGFMTGAMIGFAGALLSALAALKMQFWLLCAGSLLAGGYNAFGQYYRFAAAEAVRVESKTLAISLVLGGGLMGAFLGPEGSRITKDLLPVTFLGSYIFLAAMAAVTLCVQSFLRLPAPVAAASADTEARPLATIMRQPFMVVAVASAVVGYGVMNFLMTSTPLAMIGFHHLYSDAAHVVEWHIVGMYLPSFFTGPLIRRIGVVRTILGGTGVLLAAIAAAVSGTAVFNFWLALVLVGVGWNLLYIGGTSLLTDGYRPEERTKVQGFNDLLVFGTTAITSIVSGTLLYYVGWKAISIGTLPFIMVALVPASWLLLRNRRAAAVQ